jgi:hypothetical protein
VKREVLQQVVRSWPYAFDGETDRFSARNEVMF